MIPYSRQCITQEDVDSVVKVLTSDWLTQGPTINLFERAFAQHCNAKHAVAVSNATCALYVAYRALNLKSGDLLWTSPNTFVATANAALMCGATVDFVDVDAQTHNISVSALEMKLAEAEQLGKLPKILVPVHFAGLPCAMREIKSLSIRYGFAVVEDASHAVGARYLNEPVGNCRYSDISIFSFHPVKIITTGEGGMATTNDPVLAEKMAILSSHGITRDPLKMIGQSHGPWYYQQIYLSQNFRMTDIQAALGLSQLKRLDTNRLRRKQLADQYDVALNQLPIELPARVDESESSWHLYVVTLKENDQGALRLKLYEFLREADIGVNVHYIPVHIQPFYRELGFREGDFPQAVSYYEHAITLPLFPTLSDQEQAYIVDRITDFFA
jgi:UDP-4-amino-4,6-dideoxy-N-acetyl-beta-L-altrosamine transaminase